MNRLIMTILSYFIVLNIFNTCLAQEQKSIEVLNWEDAPDVFMPYAPAIKATGGTTIYLAGTAAAPVYHQHPHVPSDFDNIPPDMEGQARIVMENIKKGLESAGASFSDVVAATRYFTDLSEQDVFNKVWGEYFDGHKPTTTTVQVVQLATDPRCLVEVTVTAVID
jgi:enamine deaminase RidA (YjgF/YER057c/UK114 family)